MNTANQTNQTDPQDDTGHVIPGTVPRKVVAELLDLDVRTGDEYIRRGIFQITGRGGPILVATVARYMAVLRIYARGQVRNMETGYALYDELVGVTLEQCRRDLRTVMDRHNLPEGMKTQLLEAIEKPLYPIPEP